MYKWGVAVSMFHETAHSVFVRERLLPCRVAVGSSGLYRVSCTRITCIQPLTRCSLTFPASSFFSESRVVVVFSRSHARHNQNQGQPLVNLQSMLHSILAGWPRGPPHSSDERQAQSMMPKIERLLIPSNKRKDEKSNTNAYGRKGRERKRMYTNACGKERKNKPQMPRAKKERPNHKRWWQTKNGRPNQASKRKTAALIRQANEKWLP